LNRPEFSDAPARRQAPGRQDEVALVNRVAVNDTMLVVWRKAATFNRCTRVSTWILDIAARRPLEALRADSGRAA